MSDLHDRKQGFVRQRSRKRDKLRPLPCTLTGAKGSLVQGRAAASAAVGAILVELVVLSRARGLGSLLTQNPVLQHQPWRLSVTCIEPHAYIRASEYKCNEQSSCTQYVSMTLRETKNSVLGWKILIACRGLEGTSSVPKISRHVLSGVSLFKLLVSLDAIATVWVLVCTGFDKIDRWKALLTQRCPGWETRTRDRNVRAGAADFIL